MLKELMKLVGPVVAMCLSIPVSVWIYLELNAPWWVWLLYVLSLFSVMVVPVIIGIIAAIIEWYQE